MGKRCACKGLMETLRDDPRLRLVPLAARALWLLLADALARMPEPGVFRLGSRPGSLAEVSMLVSAPETEVETQMETLIATGLLRRLEDGALALADLPDAGRAAVSRQNGAGGGRPRRGETPEEARLRRAQTGMMLALSGGGAKTQETQAETPRAGLLASASEENASKQLDANALGSELAEIAGLDPARHMFDFVPLAAWLRDGIAPETIRGAFRRVRARASYRVPERAGLAYFNPAVREDHAALPPAPAPVQHGPAPDYRRFERELAEYTSNGCFGAAPVLHQVAA